MYSSAVIRAVASIILVSNALTPSSALPSIRCPSLATSSLRNQFRSTAGALRQPVQLLGESIPQRQALYPPSCSRNWRFGHRTIPVSAPKVSKNRPAHCVEERWMTGVEEFAPCWSYLLTCMYQIHIERGGIRSPINPIVSA